MVTKKCQKNVNIYVCEKCAFRCSKKSNWTQHLLTRKHKNTEMVTKKCQKNALPFMCSCGNTYRYKSGLCRHKQKCTHLEEMSDINSELLCPDKHLDHMQIYENLDKCVKENEEMRKIMIEQSKQISELIPRVGNNNTSNKININVFLNEQCKDAISIMDFVKNIELQLYDLITTGEQGFVEGMSQVFVRGLRDMEMNKRPIHCSNLTKEIMYIKNDTEWTKDDSNSTLISGAIEQIKHDNFQQLQEWMKLHPNYGVSGHNENEMYMKLVTNSLNGCTTEKKQRQNMKDVVKTIATETSITEMLEGDY